MNNDKLLVVGLGNPILGDDGVGWLVAQKVERRIKVPRVEVKRLSVGGLRLMEELSGYQKAVIVDAVMDKSVPPGTIRQFPLEALEDVTAGHTASGHDTSLQTALKVGEQVGAQLPVEVQVVAIHCEEVTSFSEELTPAVASAASEAVLIIQEIIDKFCGGQP